jgi:DNA-binding transcriptional MerR regulator
MLSMTDALTIQQTAAACGLSVHTLRYYERIGLIKPVARRGNGHRRYRPADLEWIAFLLRLRATGMPLADMQRYAALREQDQALSSVTQRKRMLAEHAGKLEAHIAALGDTLEYLRRKVSLYTAMEQQLGKEKRHGRQV